MSRFTFAARKPMMKITMVLGMFPSFMGMIAVYLLMTQFNLINHLWGLILIYAAGAPMGYLTQKGFFDPIFAHVERNGRFALGADPDDECVDPSQEGCNLVLFSSSISVRYSSILCFCILFLPQKIYIMPQIAMTETKAII